MAELQETVTKLCGVRGAETEVGRWFHNHTFVVDTTEKAPWALVTHKSRTLLQSSPSNLSTKNRYEALTPRGIREQGLYEETVPAAQSGCGKTATTSACSG